MTIYIGTDPEVFLKDKKTGLFVSAHGMFPGDKQHPVPLGNYGMMQVDGHALEFNTNPAATEDEFVMFVSETFKLLKEEVKKVDEDLEIALEPVAHFDETYFGSLPELSKVLGCDPDYSSLTGKVLNAPALQDVPIRTSSGHIHIGWTQYDDAFDDAEFAKRLEVASRLTPHLLEVSKKWEDDRSIERRKYYGKEGAFRPKHYGVELRTLDCLWLTDEWRMREVYRAAHNGFLKEFGHVYAEAA